MLALMPTRLSVPIGTCFGNLKVLGEAPDRLQPCGVKFRMIRCICDCGREISVYLSNLRKGNSKSCGCKHVERARIRMTTHGKTGTRAYKTWQKMLERCRNPNIKSYSNYGGRGITVCKAWEKFENFYEDMGDPPADMSIERRDNNSGYHKENCEWATRKAQGQNKRNNVIIEHYGEKLTVSEWSRRTGILAATIMKRIERGFPPSVILGPNLTKTFYDGRYRTIEDLCKEFNRSKTTIYRRIRMGWSLSEALTIRPRKKALTQRKNERS